MVCCGQQKQTSETTHVWRAKGLYYRFPMDKERLWTHRQKQRLASGGLRVSLLQTLVFPMDKERLWTHRQKQRLASEK